MDATSEPERYAPAVIEHDSRCITLTDSPYSTYCDCATWKLIDQHDKTPEGVTHEQMMKERESNPNVRNECGCYLWDEDCPSRPDCNGNG